MEHKGLRYNEGKLLYHLAHPVATEGLIRVLTKGAKKYAAHNWERGMEWSKVIDSLKRHLAAFEQGEDIDLETGELHIDHLQCNAHFLSAYYKIYPQGDDRYQKYRPQHKIGLDIDEVICNWTDAWCEYWKMPKNPKSWFFDGQILERFADMKSKGLLDEFYLGLSPKVSPDEIPFEPQCYVTSRPVDSAITTQWLKKNGFPVRPVITVEPGTSKLQALQEAGVEVFVDDRFDNYAELNLAGICCYLFDAPHNQRYNVGYKRIKSLSDLKL